MHAQLLQYFFTIQYNVYPAGLFLIQILWARYIYRLRTFPISSS